MNNWTDPFGSPLRFPDPFGSPFYNYWIRVGGIIIAPILPLALFVTLFQHIGDPLGALREWVKLIHVYSGMIILGGGSFVFVTMRLSDEQPTRHERAAAVAPAMQLLAGWKLAAVMQLVTGGALISLYGGINYLKTSGWLIQSIILYPIALVFWWIGFDQFQS